MINETFFRTALFIYGIFCILICIYFLRTGTDNIRKREQLCRKVYPGTLITLISLLYCVPLAEPIAPDFLAGMLYPIAVVLTIICHKFADYHFSRAVSGFTILVTLTFITNLWTYSMPESHLITKLFAAFTYILAVAAITISAKPYLLRDWFRKLAVCTKMKYSTTTFFAVYALLCFIIGTLYA